MSVNFTPPPALQGDAQAQLRQMYRYLFRISEQLNVALSSMEQDAVVLRTSGGGTVSEEKLTADMDQQYRNLKSLIIKTAHTVRVEMDRVITQLDSKYLAISDWGAYREEISREIVDTAEKTVESFNYDASISELAEQAADFEAYRVEASGYITRGIIGYDDENFPIIGIAIGQDLKSKTVTIDGVEYQEIDTTRNLATYTADRITFWINGVPMAYLSNGELVVTRAIITDSIQLGDWDIAVNAQDGLTVQKRIGNALDLSGNNTITVTADKVQAVVGDLDLSANDTVSITADKVQAVMDRVDLMANEAFEMVAGEARSAQDTALEARIHTGALPPDPPIPEGKKWVDTGVTPWQLRSWLGADVPGAADYPVALPAAGKNLFRSLPDVYSFGGVSLYSDGSGGSVVSGTSGSVWVCNTFGDETSAIPYFISTRDVAFTLSGGSANVGVAVIYQKPDGTNVLQCTSGTGAKIFTLPAGAAILRTYIRVDAGVQVNYETVRPQLEMGTEATAYAAYAPAKGISIKNSKGEVRVAELVAGHIASKSNLVLNRPTGVTLRVSGDDSLAHGGGYFYAGGNVIENAPFELGGISNVDGSEFDNAYRIRSGFIPLPDALIPGVYLRPNPPEDFAFVGAFFYDAAKRFLGASNANAIGGGYMRLVFRGSGNEALSQTVAESASASIRVYVDAFGGLRGAEDQVRITSDGEVIETRRTGCLILDGVRRRVAASALTAAEGVTAYGVPIPGASALQDFPADCSHFRIINRMAAESRRVAGTMCTGTTSEGAAYLWIFVNNSDLESTNNWLKNQAEAGTPVTVVYRLAGERSRTIGRAQPIAPPVGDSTLATDATVNHAVLQCSGWAVVNDTAEMEAALGEAQLDIEEAREAASQATENLERRVRLDSNGLHLGDSQTDNELLMQSALIHFVINGERVSTIASDYHRFGNMEIRTPSSAGGIVIQSVQ